ncbi:MAG: TRAP transporter large permease subunit [Desulfobacteraceae bacterium]|nr:MAG: TRAP transporter large permease subunit [Desulfobacteraceae bacterium]
MSAIDPILLTALMFGAMMLLMLVGMPLTFALGVVSIGIVAILWGPGGLSMIYYGTFGVTYSFALSAIAPFIFMGIVLQESGIGEEAFDMIYRIMGGIPGGLAIGVVFVCALIAAMVGQTGPATLTMALIALPALMKRGYDKRMVTGVIQAGGALGILIPPSVTMIIISFLSRQSPGKMFAAGIFPGLLLVVLFSLYIYIRCLLQPQMGPPVPPEERCNWLEKLKSMKSLILPSFLIFLVLGLIIFGVTSPTEAAGVGAIGSLLCVYLHRNLTWKILKESVFTTGRIMGTIMWIIIPAVAFSKIYHGLGAHVMLKNFIEHFGIGPYGVIIMMMASYFILGMFLETAAITFLTIPLYVPIITQLGFDPIWFGILYIMCQESAYLTPPYGFNLFYMKAVAPPEITIEDIYLSIVPFVGLQIIALIFVIIFPQIALWLPSVMFR